MKITLSSLRTAETGHFHNWLFDVILLFFFFFLLFIFLQRN
jgi:hypothetical protein